MGTVRIGSLFTGTGALDTAVADVLGGKVAWVSDVCGPDPAQGKVHTSPHSGPCRYLAHRYPAVPNLGDITTVDWSQVEPVDVLCGGFPCQDVSQGGLRLGLHPDTRSGLWSHMAYAVSQLRPQLVVIENVRGLLHASAHSEVEPCPWCVGDGEGEPALRALGAVLGDLADLGYDARWCGVRAADVGAPHGRTRIFVAAVPRPANPDVERLQGRESAWRRLLPDGGAATDPGDDGREQFGEPVVAGERGALGHVADGRTVPEPPAATDTGRVRGLEGRGSRPPRTEGGGESLGESGRRDASPGGGALADADDGAAPVEWGPYRDAVERWERIRGVRAPAPTERGRSGQPRLSPAFTEWMMGLDPGDVTSVPGLSRNEQLKLLGNGVVPQQAAAALRILLGA